MPDLVRLEPEVAKINMTAYLRALKEAVELQDVD